MDCRGVHLRGGGARIAGRLAPSERAGAGGSVTNIKSDKRNVAKHGVTKRRFVPASDPLTEAVVLREGSIADY